MLELSAWRTSRILRWSASHRPGFPCCFVSFVMVPPASSRSQEARIDDRGRQASDEAPIDSLKSLRTWLGHVQIEGGAVLRRFASTGRVGNDRLRSGRNWRV